MAHDPKRAQEILKSIVDRYLEGHTSGLADELRRALELKRPPPSYVEQVAVLVQRPLSDTEVEIIEALQSNVSGGINPTDVGGETF